MAMRFPAKWGLVKAPAWLLILVLFGGCASTKAGRAGAPADQADGSATAPTVVPLEGEARPGGPAVEPTVVSEPRYRDPLIWLNRGIFKFNDVTYRYLLIPLSKGYIRVVPEAPRRGVGNFFHNLKTPVYLANDLLQLRPKRFGRHLSRFLINATLGVGGLFDPALNWFKIKKTKTGFEDTLARYRLGYGIYLVLPILGSTDLRDAAGRAADYFLNPVLYLTDDPATTAINTFDGFQTLAPDAEKYEKLRQEVTDPYIFFRNLYLQGVQRDAEHQ